MLVYFLRIIKFFKIDKNLCIFLKISLMRICSFKKKLKKTFDHSKHLNGFKKPYKSMCAFHVWPMRKHKRSDACYKWILARGYHYWAVVCQIKPQRRRLVSPGPLHSLKSSRTWLPQILQSLIFEGCWRRWFRRDTPGMGNRRWMLPASNRQRIKWHRKVVQVRNSDSF